MNMHSLELRLKSLIYETRPDEKKIAIIAKAN
jgi:hypothetical protein